MTTEQIELRGGKREGAGRPKKLKTQVKDWIKEHPFAVAALMQVLYDKGIDGDRECAMYVIDRIKGKPTSKMGIADEDKELLTAATIIAFRKEMDKLEEGSIEGEYKEIDNAI